MVSYHESKIVDSVIRKYNQQWESILKLSTLDDIWWIANIDAFAKARICIYFEEEKLLFTNASKHWTLFAIDWTTTIYSYDVKEWFIID